MQTPQTLQGFDFNLIRSHRHSPGCFSPYLTVVLHGRGDSMESFEEIDRELQIEGMNYLLLNAPTSYDEGFSWYPFTRRKPECVRRVRKQMAALLRQLESLGWYSENIFILGHSQGGLITSDLALHLETKLAGFITVSGYVHFFSRWKKSMSSLAPFQDWLFTHGQKDDVIKVQETRSHITKLNSAGVFPSWLEFKKGHEMDYDPELQAIRTWIKERMEPGLILKPQPEIRRLPKRSALIQSETPSYEKERPVQ